MNNKDTITIKNAKEKEIEISLWSVAKKISSENFAELFDNFLNFGGKQMAEGVSVGYKMRTTHRTLQRLAICFCVGIIYGISEQEYTDARNEDAIIAAKKIKEMVDNRSLTFGGYV